jgi:hypothetical protein
LTGIDDLPHLAIVDVENLVLHEHHDEQRTPLLLEKLRSSGVLRNPPAVTSLRGCSTRYMVLDGANRVSAFRLSGIPHMLVQILDEEDERMELNTWNHVVWGIHPDELFSTIKTIHDLRLQPSTPAQSFRDLMDLHSLVSLHLPNGKVFTAFTSKLGLIERVRALNRVVARYSQIANIDRTSTYRIQPLCDLHDGLAGLILLPAFELTEVMDIVRTGKLMPPGSTRFTIAPRVLHVNYPLDKLAADKSIDQKNGDLKEFLCARLSQKSIRYYAEPTFLFDE